MLDMEKVKQAMVHWIKTGEASPASQATNEGGASALHSISNLLSETGAASGAQSRLALLSPFAVSVETLIVVSRLSQAFLDVMLQTKKATAKNKVAADIWMRAHPDFAGVPGASDTGEASDTPATPPAEQQG